MDGTQTVRCEIDRKASEDIKNIIQLLMLSPKDKKIIINKAGTEVRKISRRHVREAKDIDGHTFEPRKQRLHGQRTKKQRLLKGFAKFLALTPVKGNGLVRLGYTNENTAKRAYYHQNGVPEESGTNKARKHKDHIPGKASCPRWLAKHLINNLKWVDTDHAKGQTRRGGRQRTKQKRRTVKWVMENMTLSQAAKIMYEMEDREPKKQWTIKTPAREFLGCTDHEADKILESIADYALGRK